jgi:hypothetical protein
VAGCGMGVVDCRQSWEYAEYFAERLVDVCGEWERRCKWSYGCCRGDGCERVERLEWSHRRRRIDWSDRSDGDSGIGL